MADEFKPRLAVIVSSNAYRDRQGEIVKQKAFEEDVARRWDGDTFVGKSDLKFWHSVDPIGEVVYAETQGAFLIEVARELPDGPVNLARRRGDTPIFSTVKALWDHLEQDDIEWGASPEFFYGVKDREDSEYDTILKTETSPLPRDAAANAYTFFSVIHPMD